MALLMLKLSWVIRVNCMVYIILDISLNTIQSTRITKSSHSMALLMLKLSWVIRVDCMVYIIPTEIFNISNVIKYPKQTTRITRSSHIIEMFILSVSDKVTQCNKIHHTDNINIAMLRLDPVFRVFYYVEHIISTESYPCRCIGPCVLGR
jgi:hypothetical protein